VSGYKDVVVNGQSVKFCP